jgi:hypothetical protein
MRRPCLRCGADLPPPDRDWGGRPRQYCGAACRKAGQRLRAALGDDWWRHQPWYPAWAAAEERERDRQAEAARQQPEEQRRKAGEDRKLLESMPPQVRAGVEAARRAEGERARRQFALMTLRMELELLSEKYATVLAGTGQRAQLTGQASRTEKLLWAAALAPDDAEAQALFGKARELAAKDPAQRPEAVISTADSLRAFFPPGQLRCPARHRRPCRAGRHRGGVVQQEREGAPLLTGERGCRIDQFPDPGIQAMARFVCGALVLVVPFAGLRPGKGSGARGGCRVGLPSRFRFPAVVLVPWHA